MEHAFKLVMKLGSKRIGILGLSFKAGTDDLRESPIVVLIEMLLGEGCELTVYDPDVSLSKLVGANRRYIEQAIPVISSLMVSTVNEVLEQSDVLIVSKKNKEFVDLFERIPADKTVIDLVRLQQDLTNKPLHYDGICW